MCRRVYGQASKGWGALLLLVITGAAWILFVGEAKRPELSAASQAALRRPTGYPQLVSVEPLPVADGQMCEWVPASAGTTLAVALRQQRLSESASANTQAGASSIDVDREPVRVVRDTYPTYSAIAVDTEIDEVYLQDENLFGLKVFDRLANTPATASFTEPKRVLGGINTKLEFNCGLYVDPKNGDVYSVNNDTVDTMVIFPRDARGNVLPKRELHTPHRTYTPSMN